jgi:hypothetical protein
MRATAQDAPPGSRRILQEVSDRIAARGEALQLQNSAGVAPAVGPVQAHMQDDLAAPHARRLAAGEDEVDRVLHGSELLSGDAVEALVEEATRLVVGYLR